MQRSVFFAATLLFVGCNDVLSIERATLDEAGVSQDDGASSSGDAKTPCQAYCADIMSNCTQNNAEYLSAQVCLDMCSHFEPGLEGDRDVDSLACRAYHAKAAATAPALHCRHAGPLGGGMCGSNACVPFCLLAFARCGAQPQPPYRDELACQSECKSASESYRYFIDATHNDLTSSSGDSLNCRLYHLEAAFDEGSSASATTHCPHTARLSAPCAPSP